MSNIGKVRDGLVQRAPGRWSYVVRVYDERTGKTRQKWVSRDENRQPFTTRAAAKKARDSARHEVHSGAYVTPSRQTLDEYLQQWVDSLSRTRGNRPSRRPSTIANYRTILATYVQRHPIAQREVQQLTRQMLEAHWDEVARNGRAKGGPLSARTVKYAHSLVKAALQEAVEDGVLARNPAARVGLPQSMQPAREKSAWSPEQLSRFLEATRDNRLHPLWVLLAHTGMRRGEALALQWEDVDLEEGTAYVHQAVSQIGNELVDNDTPKNRKRRTVPLNKAAVAALTSWRSVQAQEKLQAGSAWGGAPQVFTAPDGTRLIPKSVTDHFSASVARVDQVPSLTLHGLRHTCGSLLLRAGHPVHLVASLLGHDPAVLLSIYAHALPTDLSELTSQLDALVS